MPSEYERRSSGPTSAGIAAARNLRSDNIESGRNTLRVEPPLGTSDYPQPIVFPIIEQGLLAPDDPFRADREFIILASDVTDLETGRTPDGATPTRSLGAQMAAERDAYGQPHPRTARHTDAARNP